MNTNNISVAKDRKNKIVKFTGTEHLREILKEFKECMSRNNHAGVLANIDYEVPTEPTGVGH